MGIQECAHGCGPHAWRALGLSTYPWNKSKKNHLENLSRNVKHDHEPRAGAGGISGGENAEEGHPRRGKLLQGWGAGPRECLNKRLACLAGLEESMGREEDKPGKVCENQVTGGQKCWAMRPFLSRSCGAT